GAVGTRRHAALSGAHRRAVPLEHCCRSKTRGQHGEQFDREVLARATVSLSFVAPALGDQVVLAGGLIAEALRPETFGLVPDAGIIEVAPDVEDESRAARNHLPLECQVP